MVTRTRKIRGSRTQALVAEAYKAIWPAATSAGAGAAGRDVLNVPLSIEVKGRRAFQPLEWIRQARKNGRPEDDEFPAHVVMRPDGVGEASVGDFLVIRRLCDDIELMGELLLLRRGIMRTSGMDGAVDHLRDAGRGDLDDESWARRRRELLEYTERNGLMSPSARAELEELRGND